MRINLDEQHLSLADAARLLPRLRGGRKVHVSTLYRWISRGVGGVRLEAWKMGRSVVTSKEALERFFQRLSEEEGIAAPEQVPVSDRAAEAERELVRRGA